MKTITTRDFDSNLKPKDEALKSAFESVKQEEEKSTTTETEKIVSTTSGSE